LAIGAYRHFGDADTTVAKMIGGTTRG